MADLRVFELYFFDCKLDPVKDIIPSRVRLLQTSTMLIQHQSFPSGPQKLLLTPWSRVRLEKLTVRSASL
jgi:hypothetical protein